MSVALINPEIIRWARRRSSLDLEVMAKRVNIGLEKAMDWEQGREKPTFKQAQKLAQVLHLPFGYLYLRQPPSEVIPIPDLRTISQDQPKEFSADFKDILSETLRRQDWYRDYLEEQGSPEIDFVGKFNLESDPAEIARDITSTLGLKVETRTEATNWEGYLKRLMDKAEDAGVWVMRTGKVGNNTHRLLDPQEFRGFAITDKLAPAVFINGADAKAAQIFTLIHELAHLWTGASGISNGGLLAVDLATQKATETLCDKVAAEVLVPADMLGRQWRSDKQLEENIESQTRFFRVSGVVVARRAMDLGFLERAAFFRFYATEAERWRQEKSSREPGGDFYRVVPVANGKKFTEAVLRAVGEQRLLFRDGAKLLGLHLGTMSELMGKAGLA